jgi:hypothetical protein
VNRFAIRHVRMVVVLALIVAGAIIVPWTSQRTTQSNATVPPMPTATSVGSVVAAVPPPEPTAEPTALPTLSPPVVPALSARVVGLRLSEPTPTPIPPTATPAPVVPNGPLVTSRLVTF